MSKKQNSRKVKIIQFKDIISIILILIILSLSVVSNIGAVQAAKNSNNVITRDLIMFASLAYADIEKIENNDFILDSDFHYKARYHKLDKIKNVLKSVEYEEFKSKLNFSERDIPTDEQLKTIQTKALGSVENTYEYLFYNLASTKEVSDWKLVNYSKIQTTYLENTALFTGMTFKKGNDIVIAYRGTDFDDLGDWVQDILYGLVNTSGQEGAAQAYALAVAEHYLKENQNINIYVTGHSLGGYLTQIGGATLLEYCQKNVKEISYFNGMGVDFWSNLKNAIGIDEIQNDLNIKNFRTQIFNKLKKNNSIVYSHQINGDLISSLGTHAGTVIGYDPHYICIEHHNGNKVYEDKITTQLLKSLKELFKVFNNDISKYVKQYCPRNILDFVWITHETDSFFGALPNAKGELTPNIKVNFENVPEEIIYNKTATATLKIKTINCTLDFENSNISTSSFETNINKLKINSVEQTNIDYGKDYCEYTYKVSLKGGAVIGISTMKFKPGTLKIAEFRTGTNIFENLSNNVLESNSIQTKLKLDLKSKLNSLLKWRYK